MDKMNITVTIQWIATDKSPFVSTIPGGEEVNFCLNGEGGKPLKIVLPD